MALHYFFIFVAYSVYDMNSVLVAYESADNLVLFEPSFGKEICGREATRRISEFISHYVK